MESACSPHIGPWGSGSQQHRVALPDLRSGEEGTVSLPGLLWQERWLAPSLCNASPRLPGFGPAHGPWCQERGWAKTPAKGQGQQ